MTVVPSPITGRSCLRSVTELHDKAATDATRRVLSGTFTEAQLIELAVLIGQHHPVASS